MTATAQPRGPRRRGSGLAAYRRRDDQSRTADYDRHGNGAVLLRLACFKRSTVTLTVTLYRRNLEATAQLDR